MSTLITAAAVLGVGVLCAALDRWLERRRARRWLDALL